MAIQIRCGQFDAGHQNPINTRTKQIIVQTDLPHMQGIRHIQGVQFERIEIETVDRERRAGQTLFFKLPESQGFGDGFAQNNKRGQGDDDPCRRDQKNMSEAQPHGQIRFSGN